MASALGMPRSLKLAADLVHSNNYRNKQASKIAPLVAILEGCVVLLEIHRMSLRSYLSPLPLHLKPQDCERFTPKGAEVYRRRQLNPNPEKGLGFRV